MIKAVLFDVDGVLVDSLAANTKYYQDLFRVTGYNVPSQEILKSYYHMTMMDVIRAVTKSENENEVMRIWEAGRKRRLKYYPHELLRFPDNYFTVIKKLSKKYLLGIVTSRIKGGVFMIPGLASLEKYFQITVYFEDTQKHKPDPEPLILAAKRLNVLPEETVYIGDSLSDIQAARAAKMKIVIYSKNNLDGADAITAVFDQLPDLIKSFN